MDGSGSVRAAWHLCWNLREGRVHDLAEPHRGSSAHGRTREPPDMYVYIGLVVSVSADPHADKSARFHNRAVRSHVVTGTNCVAAT